MLVVRHIECCNLQAAPIPNSTGVGFLDHMLDQFHSHAQVGVGIQVMDTDDYDGDDDVDKNHQQHNKEALHDTFAIVNHHNRFATITHSSNAAAAAATSQQELMTLVGRALGTELHQLLLDVPPGQTSRFCCPLDEALVECILQQPPTKDDDLDNRNSDHDYFTYDLAPYGSYPKSGRSHIGYMETEPLFYFWKEVATASGLRVTLRKLRGDNAHHIVESSFKAVARALRNLLDQHFIHEEKEEKDGNGDIGNDRKSSSSSSSRWGLDSDNYHASVALHRKAKTERATKETKIAVALHLTPPASSSSSSNDVTIQMDTGIVVLDQILTTLAKAAQMSLTCTCQGDVWVDEHHTSEDVAISLGQVLSEALGTKAGLNRMWCSQATWGDAVVEVTMDLSNRPCLRHNLTLSEDEYVVDPTHDNEESSLPAAAAARAASTKLTVEMLEHVLDSLVVNGRMTVHIVELNKGRNIWERAMATAQAFGTALRYCAMVDCRRAGQTASSKGTLSV